MKNSNKELYRQIIMLAVPVVIQQLLNTVLNMTDTALIGIISENAISGVAVANKIYFIYQLVLYGLTNGFGIFINQYSKMRDKKSLSAIFNEGIRFTLGVSIAALAIILLFGRNLIGIYVKTDEVIELGYRYLSIITIGFVPFAFTNMYQVTYRTMGNAKIPTLVAAVAVGLNALLDVLLIFGLCGFPRLGVAGAAIATAFSRILECALLMGIAGKHLTDVKLSLHSGVNANFRKNILLRALSLMANETIWSIGLNVVFINYSYTGESFIPAITAVDSIANLVYVAYSGFALSVSIITGQLLGTGRLDEVKKDVKLFLKLTLAIYFVGGVLLILTSSFTPRLFSLLEQNRQMASRLLIVKALLAWCEGFANTVYYILRAGGDTVSVLIIDGLFIWFGPVLFSTIAARILGLNIFYTYLLTECTYLMKVVVATTFLKKGKWIKNLTEARS